MHEKGRFTTYRGVIFNKLNSKIKIREASFIVSKSQNFTIKIGEAKDLFKYFNVYKNSLKKEGHEAMAEDLEILTLKRNSAIFSQDDICTLLNYVQTNPSAKLIDMLKEPELKLLHKIRNLQFYGY